MRVAPIPSGGTVVVARQHPSADLFRHSARGVPLSINPQEVFHHSNQLVFSLDLPVPTFPQEVPRGASLEATGDSLHLALVLRESRFGELAITLTELELRETDSRNIRWTT